MVPVRRTYGVCLSDRHYPSAIRIREGQGCRICELLAETDEERRARLTKTKPQTYTMKVTSVVAEPGAYGPGDFGPDSFGGSDFHDLADVTEFVVGQAIDFYDDSGARYRERERWRGREDEANRAGNTARDEWNDKQCAFMEAAQRPRAVVEVGPEPGSAEAREAIDIAVGIIISQMKGDDVGTQHPADARIGHTSREVEETIARICPPESRRIEFTHWNAHPRVPVRDHMLVVGDPPFGVGSFDDVAG